MMGLSRDRETVPSELEELLRGVARDHHQGFMEIDGDDPEWPIWYAERLYEPLVELLGASMTSSEIIYLLVHLSREHERVSPDVDWARYYSDELVDRYLD